MSRSIRKLALIFVAILMLPTLLVSFVLAAAGSDAETPSMLITLSMLAAGLFLFGSVIYLAVGAATGRFDERRP